MNINVAIVTMNDVDLLKELTVMLGYTTKDAKVNIFNTTNLTSVYNRETKKVVAYYKGEIIVNDDVICTENHEWIDFISNNRNMLLDRYSTFEVPMGDK